MYPKAMVYLLKEDCKGGGSWGQVDLVSILVIYSPYKPYSNPIIPSMKLFINTPSPSK